jgi:hypothetical protein
METKNMNQEMLADIWSNMSEYIQDKDKEQVAQEYITLLLDYGISESVLEGMSGIDTYLDGAIEYALDQENLDDEDDWN